MLVKSRDVLATIPLDAITSGFERAEVRLEGLKPPVQSFEARFFAGEPDAGAQTATYGNPHFLGSQFFYGLGVADTGNAPDDLYRIDRASQSERTQVRVNVTSGLRAFLARASGQSFPLTVVTADRDGAEILDPDLDVEGVSLQVT